MNARPLVIALLLTATVSALLSAAGAVPLPAACENITHDLEDPNTISPGSWYAYVITDGHACPVL